MGYDRIESARHPHIVLCVSHELSIFDEEYGVGVIVNTSTDSVTNGEGWPKLLASAWASQQVTIVPTVSTRVGVQPGQLLGLELILMCKSNRDAAMVATFFYCELEVVVLT